MSPWLLAWSNRGTSEKAALQARLRPAVASLAALSGSRCESHWVGGALLISTRRDASSAAAPGVAAGCDLALLFDGRLDDTEGLTARLDAADRAAMRDLSVPDAAKVLLAYRRLGTAFLEDLVGPFALAIVDAARGRVLLARDGIGDRGLYVTALGDLTVAATLQAPLLALGIDRRPDLTSLARLALFEGPPRGRTYFQAISSVDPGHARIFHPDRVATHRFWRPHRSRALFGVSSRGVVEALREALDVAVRRRLRDAGDVVAVSMSGGLDSTSVAARAAADRRRRGERPPIALSWVFPETPAADETVYVNEMCRPECLRCVPIVGDDAWTGREDLALPPAIETPLKGPFEALHRLTYEKARALGCTVVLTGESGDHLFAGKSGWLEDALRCRALGAVLTGFFRHVAGRVGWSQQGLLIGWREALRGARPGGRLPVDSPWLTPTAARLIEVAADEATGDAAIWRAFSGPLSPLVAAAYAGERARILRLGIEVRRPFRDRTLIELGLSLPRHYAYRPGWDKWILRTAMAPDLPPRVRRRRAVSTLAPLMTGGLARARSTWLAALLGPGARWWPQLFDRRWLEAVAVGPPSGLDAALLWVALNIEEWGRRLEGDGRGVWRFGNDPAAAPTSAETEEIRIC